MTASITHQAHAPLMPLAGPQRLLRTALFDRLRDLAHGQVVYEDALGRRVFGRATPGGLSAHVHVHDPRAYLQVALGGDLGVAESYIDGRWSCDDLVSLFRIFTRNIELSDRLSVLSDRLVKLRYRVDHWMRKNTRAGSRDNIYAHYDLSNDFFALFLDETMTYSAGIFEREGSSMYEASVAKLDRICRKLALTPNDHVLEIGTGWGSLAMHAAERYGCHVTTTTISDQQYALAARRVRAAGLQGRITLLRRDYRDLQGQFDKLVSVEMIEAVGHEYFDDFFRVAGERLRPEGMMLLQAITVPDQRYDSARRSVDPIRHLIFPGSVIPSTTALLTAATRASDLRLVHLEDITPHYARTLAAWRAKFWDNIAQIRAQGRDERFIRLWDYYLASCQAAFTERYLGDVQMLLAKPGCRAEPILPRLPAADELD
ncbi:class I SAM-dependent methyltransferase [Haliangium sp.]|uniref:class I SAM-dependent methyltransferase n=1 Tax=Haliangium sp. TaxID=2663208 RepID=UPI003D144DE8